MIQRPTPSQYMLGRWQLRSTPCGIHERQLKNGKIKLYRVLEENSEQFSDSHGSEIYEACRGYAR